MARISAIASLENNHNHYHHYYYFYYYDQQTTSDISHYIVTSHQQARGVPVAMHKDSFEDGVHHVLYFILVFLKLQREKHQVLQTF